jgi:hypothetical protein
MVSLNNKNYILKPSDRKDKKFMVITPENKTIHFGARGYGDFIQYSKENKELALKKRDAYLKRHIKNEDWTDLNTAGTWARYILWGEPTLSKSIKEMEKRFKIKII